MPSERKKIWVAPAALCIVLAVLWAFPKIWYTRKGEEQAIWFAERSDIEGWKYTSVPVDKAAERALVADRTVNGEFDRGAAPIRVFSAKRYEEKANEIGLFVHTPDRCWTEGGWTVEPVAPDIVEVTVHGARMTMERRVFDFKGSKELVYFCGLVGGQPLPYRLDHNLSVGMRIARKDGKDAAMAATRASDTLFWNRLWKSFASRRALSGPKQFIRVSTPILNGDTKRADEILQQFIPLWLVPGNYSGERAALKVASNR
jgi:hypothetical protein